MSQQAALHPSCREALSNAAMSGNWRGLQLLLAMPAVREFINVPDHLGMTPLHIACYAREPPCVHVLVAAGAANVPTGRRRGISPQWPVDCAQHFVRKHPLRMERDELSTFQMLSELGFA